MALRRSLALLLLLILLASCGRGFFTTSSPGVEPEPPPGDPTDTDIYELSAEEAARIPSVPTSMEEAVAALGADHQYLLEGDVFTQDVIDHYIAFKEQESRDVFMHPVPAEFFHYYHI